jgi:hypothetical protein
MSTPAEPTDRDRIRQTLEQWPRDFNRKDKGATCALFAPDLVASYPGQPDKDFEAMRKSLNAALDHPPTRRWSPDSGRTHTRIGNLVHVPMEVL